MLKTAPHSFSKLILVSIFLVGFFFLYSIVIPTEILASSWPMFLKDSVHSGFDPDETDLKPPLEEKWTFETGSGFSSAIVIDETVYVESGSPAILYALDATTGQEKWSYQTERASHASPAYFDNTILSGSHCVNCPFEAIDAQTGTLKWSLSLPQGSRDPNVVNGIAYFGSDDKRVRAVDVGTGNLLWTSPILNDGVTSVPAVSGNKVFVGTWSSRFYALNVSNGSVAWFFNVDPSKHVIFSSPSVEGNTVFFGSGNAKIFALDVNTGSQKWVFGPTLDSVWGSPGVANDRVFVQSLRGKIYSIDTNTGNLIWDYQTGAPTNNSYSSPAIANGVVYIGSTDEFLYAFDEADGNILWSYDLGGPIIASPAIANGMVYVGTTTGKFYAFEQDNELDVPYFSQTDGEWVEEVYDSTTGDIGGLGCAITAASMILNHYGLTHFADNTPVNPSTVNSWLIANNGYGLNGGLVFPKIATLSQELADAAGALGTPVSFEALEYSKFQPPSLDYPTVDSILTEQEQPLIFEEVKAESPSGVHFDVARGVVTSGEEYVVNDPLDENRESFLQPPDELVSVRYFEPSSTDLSALLLQADVDLNVLITNPEGSQAGQLVNIIANADFYLQKPITSYVNPSETTGDAFWEFYAKNPPSGGYHITFSAEETGWYDFRLFAFSENGDDVAFDESVFVTSDQPTTFTSEYNQADVDLVQLKKQVTFDKLKTDINAMWEEGYITKKGIKNALLATASLAEHFYPHKLYKLILNLFERQLEQYHPRFVTDEAHEVLSEDLELLRESL